MLKNVARCILNRYAHEMVPEEKAAVWAKVVDSDQTKWLLVVKWTIWGGLPAEIRHIIQEYVACNNSPWRRVRKRDKMAALTY